MNKSYDSFQKLPLSEKLNLAWEGKLFFPNQEEKLDTLNTMIKLVDNYLNSLKNSKDYESILNFRTIRIFLDEYRDVLEQIEIDWIEDEERK